MAHRLRFLISLRWLGLGAVALVLMTACVYLGIWQHGRYEERAATNDRIAAADADDSPAGVETVLSTSRRPADDEVWAKVVAEGSFDESGQILIRNRSVAGQTGYEVITPLVLADGTAVLIDRGWIPPSEEGATALPEVPAVPEGEVTITGRVRASEGELGEVNQVDGIRQARSINVDQISDGLGYQVMDGYVIDEEPGADFAAIPVVTERSWQNFAYAYQWWLFAAMIPVGLIMIGRREFKLPATPK